MARRLNRGDVFLYRFQPPDKERPVVLLTCDTSISLLSSVTVAPISSSVRGVPTQVRLDVEDGMKGPCAINLHNTMTVTQAKLGPWVTRLSAEKMHEVCKALNYALGCH